MASIIKLNLRGTVFARTTSSIDRFPDSLLAAAFCNSSTLQASTIFDGAYYFDRDPELYERIITKLYDTGLWKWMETDGPRIVFVELTYWGLAPTQFPEPGQLLSAPQYIALALAKCFTRV